ncbi:MAG: IS1634 family transposase [bacterium]|jgi:hypothetical protein
MYFRQKKSRNGSILQLIRSFRDEKSRPRQQVVCSLGSANIPEEDRSVVAERVEILLSGQQDIIPVELSLSQKHWVDFVYSQIQLKVKATIAKDGEPEGEVQSVCIDQIEHTKSSRAGAEIVALEAWKQLEMATKLRELGLNESQIHAATVSVLNRLIDPVSENALLDWLDTSSLPDLLDAHFDGKDIKSRFYRVSDQVYAVSEELQAHLRDRQDSIWGYRNSIFLYDLTNTYFEGSASMVPEAKRGNSKEKRHDCPLISIAIAYSGDGLPRSHKFFAGNTHDGVSFPEMLSSIEADKGCTPEDGVKPLFVMDAGIASAQNLKLLRDKGYDYLVHDNRKNRGNFEEDYGAYQDEFMTLEGKGVSVYRKETEFSQKFESSNDEKEDWKEFILLCQSNQRKEKESAILERSAKSFEKEIKKLATSVAKGSIKQADKIHEKIGRIRNKHSRVSRFYEVDLVISEEGSGQKIRLSQKESFETHLNQTGRYILRSTCEFSDPQEMWMQYMSLTNAEDGFRCLKSHLGLRPIFHQTSKRCFGHLFISILALHLLCHIKRKLLAAGLEPRSWTSIKRELQTHCYSTLIVPVKDKGVYHIRKLGNANQKQRAIYEAMGLDWNHYRRTAPSKKIFKST